MTKILDEYAIAAIRREFRPRDIKQLRKISRKYRVNITRIRELCSDLASVPAYMEGIDFYDTYSEQMQKESISKTQECIDKLRKYGHDVVVNRHKGQNVYYVDGKMVNVPKLVRLAYGQSLD